MAIKFQYNKTSKQQLEKQLKMRVRTLPIIKNKETALRIEVKKSKMEADELDKKLEQQIQGYEAMYALWSEFDASLVELKDVKLNVKKVAGGDKIISVSRFNTKTGRKAAKMSGRKHKKQSQPKCKTNDKTKSPAETQ